MELNTSRRATYILLLLGMVAVALVVTISVVRQRLEIRKKAAPVTVLELEPSSASANQGDQFELDVVMRTGSNQVTRADITINFEAAYLQGVSFTQGTFLPDVVLSGLVDNGVASIILEAPTTSPANGEGTVATLRLLARNPVDSTQISFDSSTNVSALGEPGNALSSTSGSTVSVNRTVFADTTLRFDPSSLTVSPNQEFSVNMVMNTGTNLVTAADVIVNYDSSVLDGVSLIGSNFLPQVFADGVNSNGTAHIILGSSTDAPAQGEGVIAVLTFQARSSGSTALSFGSTSVKAFSTDENMLKSADSGTVSISGTGGPDPTPQPTPIPTASPAPTSTPATDCTRARPAAPTGVRAVTQDQHRITLYWNEAVYATHYGIVYGTSSATYQYGAADLGFVTSYTVGGLASNTTYYFAVFAVNDCAVSGYSSQVSARTQAYPISDTSRPTTYVASPSPDTAFVPLKPDQDPIPFLTGNLSTPEPPSPLPEVDVPEEYAEEPEPEPQYISSIKKWYPVPLILLFLFVLWRSRHKLSALASKLKGKKKPGSDTTTEVYHE